MGEPERGPWPERVRRGLDYAAWTPEGYGTEESMTSLADLAGTGATDVAVVVTGYMDSLTDSTVEEMPIRTPTQESVSAALTEARRLGLRAVLKPHVDVVGGAYRGQIAPDDPHLWFETYRVFLLTWAAFAEAEGLTELWIGTELESMTHIPRGWEETVAAAREVFGGTLVYAANWSDIQTDATIEVGRLVDRVGVDAFFPVSDWPDPTVADMVVAWQPWLLLLEDLERRTGRPVTITEIGCMSRRGAPVSPWDYEGSAPIDLEVQARYYEAALLALPTCPAVRGIYFWAWGIGPGGPDDGAHTPRAKPAEEVLRSFWLDGN